MGTNGEVDVNNNKTQTITTKNPDGTYSTINVIMTNGKPSVEYVISLIWNAQDSEGNPITRTRAVQAGKSLSMRDIDVPEKEGYTFRKWYTDPQLTNEYRFGTAVNSSFYLYAGWDINVYTVAVERYAPVYGTTGQYRQIGRTTQRVNWSDLAIEPSREVTGYDIQIIGGKAAYYQDSALTVPFSFDTPITKNMTVYALYQPKIYNVTFVDRKSVV